MINITASEMYEIAKNYKKEHMKKFEQLVMDLIRDAAKEGLMSLKMTFSRMEFTNYNFDELHNKGFTTATTTKMNVNNMLSGNINNIDEYVDEYVVVICWDQL